MTTILVGVDDSERSLDAIAWSTDSWAAASSLLNTFRGQSWTVVPRR